MHSWGDRFHCGQRQKNRTKDIKKLFKSIQTLDLILDLSKCRLSCVINEDKTKEYIAFEHIIKRQDVNYTLSVMMLRKGDAISILDFDMC